MSRSGRRETELKRTSRPDTSCWTAPMASRRWSPSIVAVRSGKATTQGSRRLLRRYGASAFGPSASGSGLGQTLHLPINHEATYLEPDLHLTRREVDEPCDAIPLLPRGELGLRQ